MTSSSTWAARRRRTPSVGADALNRPETYLPLKVLACPECGLVQVDELQRRDELFSADYVYFSSYSASWLAHARDYVAQVVERLQLGSRSQVVEVASNDGYLLQYVQQRGVPCVGVEPTDSTARGGARRGIETIGEFFGVDFARRFAAQRGHADLVLGNNVLAHVPDINDFVAGLREVLAPAGCITLEFPHLLNLVAQSQFDTVYHEHFSYLSLRTVQRICAAQRLRVWDVEDAAHPRRIAAGVAAARRPHPSGHRPRGRGAGRRGCRRHGRRQASTAACRRRPSASRTTCWTS